MRGEHFITGRRCTEPLRLAALRQGRLWAGWPLRHVTTTQLVGELDEVLPCGRLLVVFEPEPTPRKRKPKSTNRIASKDTT